MKKPEMTWNIWTLSTGDINDVAKHLGLSDEQLAGLDLDDIAHEFQKSVERFLCDDWERMLKDAIQEVETSHGL